MYEEVLLDDNKETDRLTKQLCEAIRNSEEFKHYHDCLERIKQNEELYNQVNILRRNNFMVQNGMNGKMSYEEYHNIYNFSRNARLNTLVNEFLDSEVGITRLMQGINYKLISAIEFDSDFLK